MGSWESAQRLAGQATSTDDAAADAIATTRTELGLQGDRLAPFDGQTIAIAFQLADALQMIPGNEIGGRAFAELGLTVAPTPDGTAGIYSLEQVPELLGDADVIVSFDFGGLADQDANPLFQALPAVQAGRYVALPPEIAAACYQESSLSLRWAARGIADALLAVAG